MQTCRSSCAREHTAAYKLKRAPGDFEAQRRPAPTAHLTPLFVLVKVGMYYYVAGGEARGGRESKSK